MRRFNIGETIKSFAHDTSGATAIEYAMIAGGISIVIVGGVALIGGNLTALFEAVGALF